MESRAIQFQNAASALHASWEPPRTTAFPVRGGSLRAPLEKPQPTRLIGIDAARVLAALGTAWVHTCESPQLAWTGELGRFAVPFFNTVAAYMIVSSVAKSPYWPMHPFIWSRFSRLYLPFLAWTGIYLAVRSLKHLTTGEPAPYISRGLLFDGASHQLWFLPFLLLASLLAQMATRVVIGSRAGRLVLAAMCVAGAVALTATAPEPVANQVLGTGEYFVERAWGRSPSFLLGLAFALVAVPLMRGQGEVHTRSLVTSALICVPAVCAWVGCVLLGALGPTELRLGFQTLAGVWLALAAFGPWRHAAVGRLASLHKATFGIFLAHTLFIEGLQTLMHIAGVEPAPWIDVLVYAAAVAGSLGLTAVLQASRFTRWMIP